ncbi:MAG: DUF881 domain-containing protein [bacterium]|nr:DUF881 domain-containing protein [bacterium]
MKIRRNILLVVAACLLLGFILSRQFFLQKKLKTETQPEQERELAIEVSRLIKGNQELTLERNKLTDQYSLIRKSSDDKEAALESMQSSIEQYNIILGKVAVTGSGVVIQFDEMLDTTQITDLMNALRNIGAEAIAINGKRITPTTGWDYKTFSSPYKIQAIGDSKLLKDSLERRGGIMENVGFSGTVSEEKKISLPAAK